MKTSFIFIIKETSEDKEGTMRCRRYDYRYSLTIQSNRSLDEWLTKKINVVIAKTHWCPAADIYETADKIYVIIEIAGVDPDQIEIALYEDALVVKGLRRLQPLSNKGMYHMAEIRQGPFCFELPLSISVDLNQDESHYEHGLLSIVLNKHLKSKP